tara:strand:+ start:107 stop:355 length:249 start_codon:yes stop_codon:yes gene_type:complete
MSQYIVRKGKYNYEIAKFNDTDTPIDIYSFYLKGCSCPARSRSCKHTRIVNTWKRAGFPEGDVYNDNAEKIGNIFTFSFSPC